MYKLVWSQQRTFHHLHNQHTPLMDTNSNTHVPKKNPLKGTRDDKWLRKEMRGHIDMAFWSSLRRRALLAIYLVTFFIISLLIWEPLGKLQVLLALVSAIALGLYTLELMRRGLYKNSLVFQKLKRGWLEDGLRDLQVLKERTENKYEKGQIQNRINDMTTLLKGVVAQIELRSYLDDGPFLETSTPTGVSDIDLRQSEAEDRYSTDPNGIQEELPHFQHQAQPREVAVEREY